MGAAAGTPFRWGVCLSSGFFGFYAHTGFVLALEERGIVPAAVAGSSAGALVGALWASGRDGPDIRERLVTLRRTEFWDPAPLRDWLRGPPGLLRGEAMQRLLETHLGCRTFAECRFPLVVNAFDLNLRREVELSEGLLAPAVRASATLPGLFQPLRRDGHWLLDAGFVEKTPVRSLLARPDVDGVLIHHLRSAAAPSFAGRPGPLDMIRSGLQALRGRLDETNLEAARAAGKPLVVLEPEVPRVDPFHLERGRGAVDAALAQARRRLQALPTVGAPV